jgi:hypothetical protein
MRPAPLILAAMLAACSQIDELVSDDVTGDPEPQLDCAYDGDNGSGNDGCRLHACCLLDGDCTDADPDFDPADCVVSDACAAACTPLAPAGCDCFGCCTRCDDDGCVDVMTNGQVAPACDGDGLRDPERCPPCTPLAACAGG